MVQRSFGNGLAGKDMRDQSWLLRLFPSQIFDSWAGIVIPCHVAFFPIETYHFDGTLRKNKACRLAVGPAMRQEREKTLL